MVDAVLVTGLEQLVHLIAVRRAAEDTLPMPVAVAKGRTCAKVCCTVGIAVLPAVEVVRTTIFHVRPAVFDGHAIVALGVTVQVVARGVIHAVIVARLQVAVIAVLRTANHAERMLVAVAQLRVRLKRGPADRVAVRIAAQITLATVLRCGIRPATVSRNTVRARHRTGQYLRCLRHAVDIARLQDAVVAVVYTTEDTRVVTTTVAEV
jgi:hypothetical protein